MKRTITKLVLLLLAVLTTGSVNAVTETYDFTGFTNNTFTASGTESCDKVNGENMNLLQLGSETFNNRFAVSRAGTENVNSAWVVKNHDKDDTHQHGLFSCWNDRYFTILGLHKGDKIKIVWSTESSNGASLKFYGQPALDGVSSGAAVTSSSDYTVMTDDGSVNINLVTDKGSESKGDATKVYIKSVTIERASVSVPVTINIIPDATTEEYDFVTNWYGTNRTYIDTADPLTVGTNSFGNRFSVSRVSTSEKPEDGFLIRGYINDTKGLWTKFEDRNFTIKNLNKDDKIVITWHCDGSQNTNNDGKFVFIDSYPHVKIGAEGNELAQNTEVTSGQEYIVTRDNVSVAIRAKKGTSNTDPYVSITAVNIYPVGYDTGTYTGATLVSGKALDFTDVDGITAYVATAASAGSVTFSPVTKVAANTPLYIKANATSGSAINVDVPEATEGAVDYTASNLLKGSATQTTNVQSTGDTKYYVFGVQNGEAGFYNAASSFTSAVGKAYLELTAAQAAAARSLNLIFDEEDSETTGINDVRSKKEEVRGEYYDLSGRRVAQPTRGLYIVNGKKVIIK